MPKSVVLGYILYSWVEVLSKVYKSHIIVQSDGALRSTCDLKRYSNQELFILTEIVSPRQFTIYSLNPSACRVASRQEY